MVTITKLNAKTPINGFGIGIGEFFNPTPIELWDGKDAGEFPESGTVPVSKIQIVWEHGKTTGFGSYSVTDQSLNPHPVPMEFRAKGPDGGLKAVGMSEPLTDTLIDGQTIGQSMGISNEVGFYMALFEGEDSFLGSNLNDRMFSYDGNDELEGRRGKDLIRAGDGDDTIRGGAQADRLYGENGKDDIHGGSGNDSMWGGKGKDMMLGGGGRDRMFGNGGNDTLNGDFGNDILNGGNGNDTLEGGAGDDTLKGGAGKDTGVYREHEEGKVDLGVDTFLDFKPGKDELDFRDTQLMLADLTIQPYADGTKILIDTNGIEVEIRLQGVETGEVQNDDFLFA